MGLELAEQKQRPERRPIHAPVWTSRSIHCAGRLRGLIDHAQKRIGAHRTTLRQVRRVEKWTGEKRAAAKRRFSAELLEYQLLDRIIENAKPRTNARLARTAKHFSEPPICKSRTVRNSDARGKGLVIS